MSTHPNFNLCYHSLTSLVESIYMKAFTVLIKAFLILLLFCSGFFFTEISTYVKSYISPKIQLNNTCHLSTQICQQNGIAIILEKDTLTPLQPSSISVNWPNNNADSLTITLQGYDMAMGNPTFKLLPNADKSYSGDILLPICTQNTMIWVGTISDGKTSINVSLKAEQ